MITYTFTIFHVSTDPKTRMSCKRLDKGKMIIITFLSTVSSDVMKKAMDIHVWFFTDFLMKKYSWL